VTPVRCLFIAEEGKGSGSYGREWKLCHILPLRRSFPSWSAWCAHCNVAIGEGVSEDVAELWYDVEVREVKVIERGRRERGWVGVVFKYDREWRIHNMPTACQLRKESFPKAVMHTMTQTRAGKRRLSDSIRCTDEVASENAVFV
jgi:hypothetical protein